MQHIWNLVHFPPSPNTLPAFTRFCFSAGANGGSSLHPQDCHPPVFPLPFQGLRDSSIPSIPPLTLPPLCLASRSLPNPVWFYLCKTMLLGWTDSYSWNCASSFLESLKKHELWHQTNLSLKLGSTPWEFLFCFTLGWLFHFYFYGRIKIPMLLDFSERKAKCRWLSKY